MNIKPLISSLTLAFLYGCDNPNTDDKKISVEEIDKKVFLTDHNDEKVYVLKDGVFQEIKRDSDYWRPHAPISKNLKIDNIIALSMKIEYIGAITYYSFTFTSAALPKFEVTNNLGEKIYAVDHDNYNDMVRRVRNGTVEIRFENSNGMILQNKVIALDNVIERSVDLDRTPQLILSGSFNSLLLPTPLDQPLKLTLSHNI